MMLPTTRPRCCSGARCAASGISICTATELNPISSAYPRNNWPWPLLLVPASNRLTQASTAVATISRRFSSRSASGTSNNRPRA
ncbi:hypothetical protein D3C85_1432700 [compost metagenome]